MESHSKVCSKCKEEKLLNDFYKNRTKMGGYQNECKVCSKKRDRDYYQKNREQRIDYQKNYYESNREDRLRYRKYHYQKNRDEILQWQRQHYQKNREKARELGKKHYQQNREVYYFYREKRRASKIKAIPKLIVDCMVEKKRLVQIYRLRDLLTKASGVQHHVDHIWPLSKGGPHWSGNLQIITAEENLSKGDSMCEETARVIQESLDEYCSTRQ